MCVTWLIVCVTWLITSMACHMLCVMAHSYLPHDWVHTRDMTHSMWDMTRCICDMTHSCVWHDSFVCVTWLIRVCDMTHWYVWHDSMYRSSRGRAVLCMEREKERVHPVMHHVLCCAGCVTHHYVCDMTWLINMCDLISLICVCGMNHYCVWHDSLVCDMTHSFVWHDSLVCVTWLISVWHDSFVCVTWLIGVCGMTH